MYAEYMVPTLLYLPRSYIVQVRHASARFASRFNGRSIGSIGKERTRRRPVTDSAGRVANASPDPNAGLTIRFCIYFTTVPGGAPQTRARRCPRSLCLPDRTNKQTMKKRRRRRHCPMVLFFFLQGTLEFLIGDAR